MDISKEKHMEKVKKQFSQQAGLFNKEGYSLTSKEYLRWAIDNLPLDMDQIALDVATGTGILSRELAKHVKKVYGTDVNDCMLNSGKEEAKMTGLSNIVFIKGLAESLPFADKKFDLVTCRLAFHHFYEVNTPFNEMIRVTKDGGHIAVMDLISPENKELAIRYNKLETLRDNSHTYALTQNQLLDLFNNSKLKIKKALLMDVEMRARDWLNLTKTPREIQSTIIKALENELTGGEETGMNPYIKDGNLYFLHKWMLIVAQKD